MGQPLWDFSLGFYGEPGVAAACLRCQDEAGADVPVLLVLLWQAAAGVRFEANVIAELDRAVADWRVSVVQPLRSVRRFLKVADGGAFSAAGALRERIKAAELEAERLELETLSRRVTPLGQAGAEPDAQAARHNLAAYEAATGRVLPVAAVEELITALVAKPGEVRAS